MRTLSKVKSSAIIPRHPSVPNLIGLATIIYALRCILNRSNQGNLRFLSEFQVSSGTTPFLFCGIQLHFRRVSLPTRVHMNTAYTIEGLDSGCVWLSSPQALRPLQKIYQRIDEHLSDNCAQEIALRYEVGHRWTEFVVSIYKSRTQGILQ